MDADGPPREATTSSDEEDSGGGAGTTGVDFVDPVSRIRPEQVEASAPGSFVRRVTEARKLWLEAVEAGQSGDFEGFVSRAFRCVRLDPRGRGIRISRNSFDVFNSARQHGMAAVQRDPSLALRLSVFETLAGLVGAFMAIGLRRQHDRARSFLESVLPAARSMADHPGPTPSPAADVLQEAVQATPRSLLALILVARVQFREYQVSESQRAERTNMPYTQLPAEGEDGVTSPPPAVLLSAQEKTAVLGEAVEEAAEAARLDGTIAEAHALRGWALAQSHREAEACVSFSVAALKTSEDDPYAARLWYSQVYTALHSASRPRTAGKLREAMERADKARKAAEALWGHDLRETPFDYEHRRFAKTFMRTVENMPDDKPLSARPDVNTLVAAGKAGASAAGGAGGSAARGGREGEDGGGDDKEGGGDEGGRDDEG